MTDDSVIKKVVRDVVKEELKSGLDSFKLDLLEAIEEKNYNLRSDVAKMKDEIVGELKTIHEEQTMLNGRTAKINQIEDQVEKLEDIHPQGQHSTI